MSAIQNTFAADANKDGILDTVHTTYVVNGGTAEFTAYVDLGNAGGRQDLGTVKGSPDDILHLDFKGANPQSNEKSGEYHISAIPFDKKVVVSAQYQDYLGTRWERLDYGPDEIKFKKMNADFPSTVEVPVYGPLVQLVVE